VVTVMVTRGGFWQQGRRLPEKARDQDAVNRAVNDITYITVFPAARSLPGEICLGINDTLIMISRVP
jgi:hypothetical protein